MPVKDTYSYEKPAGGGPKRPYWTEDDGKVVTQLTVDDQMDSVSFNITADVKGIWAPTMKAEAGVRATYSDAQHLRDYLTGILVARGIETPQPAGTLVPRFAEDIGPNEPVVTFCRFECRACGEFSEVVRDVGDSAEYAWLTSHRTGAHGGAAISYYKWSVTRNTGREGVL